MKKYYENETKKLREDFITSYKECLEDTINIRPTIEELREIDNSIEEERSALLLTGNNDRRQELWNIHCEITKQINVIESLLD